MNSNALTKLGARVGAYYIRVGKREKSKFTMSKFKLYTLAIQVLTIVGSMDGARVGDWINANRDKQMSKEYKKFHANFIK